MSSPTALPYARPTQRQEDLRTALQLGSGPLVVGIGRLVEQKNWPVFIEAAAAWRDPFRRGGLAPFDSS